MTNEDTTATWAKVKAARLALTQNDPPDVVAADAALDEAEGIMRAACPLCEPDDPGKA